MRDKNGTGYRKPNTGKTASILLCLAAILAGFQAHAQPESKLIREGNKSYGRQNYSEAEKNYRKALEKNKGSVKGQFNLGDAVYQQKNYEESSKVFSTLAETNLDPKTKAKVLHNLGNSLLESKQYEQSILAYKNALLNNPSDLDTKYNLEYAKKMLEKQQQQQQNQNKQDQQKKEQQKKDQQDQNKDQQDQDKKNQPPDQNKKISKEDAERMLEALKNDEKKTMEKLKKEKAKIQQQSVIEKDW
jgi:tetratricopeptide (TPR) repeat protein